MRRIHPRLFIMALIALTLGFLPGLLILPSSAASAAPVAAGQAGKRVTAQEESGPSGVLRSVPPPPTSPCVGSGAEQFCVHYLSGAEAKASPMQRQDVSIQSLSQSCLDLSLQGVPAPTPQSASAGEPLPAKMGRDRRYVPSRLAWAG